MRRLFVVTAAVVVVLGAGPTTVVGQGGTQASETWSPPRTLWGHPDLQGTWSNTTKTPLERPQDLAGKEFLSEEEWAAWDERRVASGQSSLPMPTGAYNTFWLEQGVLAGRTSLIVDPPDGRLPPVTLTEQKHASERVDSYVDAADRTARIDSWEDLNVYDRCLTRGMPGLMMPGYYNHNYQILQTPDYVAIVVEMIHDARIIPLDERTRLRPSIRQWLGDSHGHWDGDTLVIETANFTEKVHGSVVGNHGTVFGGNSHHVVERLTLTDAGTIDYRVTVTNPTVWTGSWTASMPMRAIEGRLFEYACHEGNHALPNMLSGNRADESAETGRSK